METIMKTILTTTLILSAIVAFGTGAEANRYRHHHGYYYGGPSYYYTPYYGGYYDGYAPYYNGYYYRGGIVPNLLNQLF
jgi:hypothetical protein